MKKRISHNKSRNGCTNCKKRHVKCDEQGPPCGGCIAREFASTCTYKSSPPAQNLSPPSSSVQSGSGSSVVSTSSESNLSPPVSNSLSNSITPTTTNHLLELELMHRWSTTTFLSLISVPEDNHYLQIEVPRGALKHTYLLHGIFSITALETAITSTTFSPLETQRYICISMEYYDRASESFRAALCSVTPENQHFLYIFAIAATIINLCMPASAYGDEVGPRMLDRMVVLFELLMGACSIALLDFNWMLESPFSPSLLSALSLLEKPAEKQMSESTKKAFEGLTAVIDSINQEENAIAHAAYTKVAAHLHYCFKEESKGLIRGFCIAFPVLAGEDYTAALRKSESLALFILMYWGVLLDKLGSEAWWTANIGVNLVSEISDALLQMHDVPIMAEWNAGIAWARTEVGLDVLD